MLRIRWMMRSAPWPTGAPRTRCQATLKAVANKEEDVFDPTIAQVGEHCQPKNLADSPSPSPGPHPRMCLAVGSAPIAGVSRPGCEDLPVADLDHDRVDEHRVDGFSSGLDTTPASPR